jgi:hypothetical protein
MAEYTHELNPITINGESFSLVLTEHSEGECWFEAESDLRYMQAASFEELKNKIVDAQTRTDEVIDTAMLIETHMHQHDKPYFKAGTISLTEHGNIIQDGKAIQCVPESAMRDHKFFDCTFQRIGSRTGLLVKRFIVIGSEKRQQLHVEKYMQLVKYCVKEFEAIESRKKIYREQFKRIDTHGEVIEEKK